jgi:hypothetical protein
MKCPKKVLQNHTRNPLILQAEMERIADTLFDHPVTEGQQRQGLKGSQ